MNRWKATGYKAGQNLVCKVLAPEPGGYSVTIAKDNVPGFLPTEAKLRQGEEVLAQFVAISNNRILLTARLSNTIVNESGKYKSPASWEQQLTNPNQSDDSDAAFQVWANTPTTRFKLKRAIDLILSPINGVLPSNIRIGDDNLEWLITDLEGGMRTGCVKALCEPRKSRSAVLLYRGRAVGCIYGSKTLSEPLPTEPSLTMMLNDLQEPDTNLLIYDLPEDVTLAVSSLFLGYPVKRPPEDIRDARTYLDEIGNWLTQREQTACLALSLPSSGDTCLVFVHKGRFAGAFNVEDQQYSNDLPTVYDFIARDPNTTISASILPPEMTSSAVRFGYSLSMAKKNMASGPGMLG